MEQFENFVNIDEVIAEISRSYEADQADRLVGYENIDWDVMRNNDEKRIVRAREFFVLSQTEKISLPNESLCKLGILLQHGNVDDVLAAQWCGEQAFSQGNKLGGWLAAAAEDRVEVYNHRQQKWGTQFRQNEAGEWEQYPMMSDKESGITDEMRASRGISSKDKQLEEFLQRDDV